MYQKLSSLQITTLETFGKFLNTNTTKCAIVSLVTSRLDYCYGLPCGITDELLCRLQNVQNNAARVVSVSKKYDRITPILKDLHWLPIRKKIEFKILLLTLTSCKDVPPIFEGLTSQISQHKDCKIKH